MGSSGTVLSSGTKRFWTSTLPGSLPGFKTNFVDRSTLVYRGHNQSTADLLRFRGRFVIVSHQDQVYTRYLYRKAYGFPDVHIGKYDA
jgi:hypothetical protein